jgi:hypothetical protein
MELLRVLRGETLGRRPPVDHLLAQPCGSIGWEGGA